MSWTGRRTGSALDPDVFGISQAGAGRRPGGIEMLNVPNLRDDALAGHFAASLPPHWRLIGFST